MSILSPMTQAAEAIQIKGIGLITGLPVQVTIQPSKPGNGIVFLLPTAERSSKDSPESSIEHLPAHFGHVVHTDRGVTLATPTGKTLSIVEHFLAACALLGLSDLAISVSGAPELPILDGSAQEWLKLLAPLKPKTPVHSDIPLKQAVRHRHSPNIWIYALPADTFELSYSVNFEHPDLQGRWVRWQPHLYEIAPARTFGFVRELPVLQAQGLARGVRPENTLGLTDEGGYTDTLRFEDEPVKHKMLDLLGDLMLTGINPLRLKAHIFAVNAGHGSHIAFAQKLLKFI